MDTDEATDAPLTMKVRNRVVGAAMALVGIYVALQSLSYGLGNIFRLGPGALPFGLGLLIVIFGALVAIVNDDGDEPAPRIVWRPVVTVLAALLAFALLIEPTGLIAAGAALVFISGAADPEHTWRSLLAIYLFLVVTVYIVFVHFLSIPFKLITGVI